MTNWKIAIACLAAATAPVFADPPAPRKVYTNRLAFSIPVKIDERDRAELRELRFFVKPIVPGQANAWQCVETAPATKVRFLFQAPHDGEYWFAFATVDQAGRVAPPDFDREPPGLIVIVDTRAPQLDVQRLTAATGESFVQCRVMDANPDLTAVQLEAVMADRSVRKLDPIEDRPGYFRSPDPTLMTGLIRATVADKAGNRTVREVQLPAAPEPGPIALASAQSKSPPTVAPAAVAPSRPTTAAETPAPAKPPERAETPPIAGAASPMLPPPGRQLLGGTHCRLDYAVDVPDVTRVEVYATRDGGRTWSRAGDDPDHRSPIEFDLPDDGVYGLALVVSTTTRPGTAPAAGDAPDCWVEIDTTRPTVAVGSARVGSGDDAGQLLISWSAQDRNLAPDPVEIQIASDTRGPWLTLARGQKPEGSARLALPRELTGRIFVRIEARDLAGNCGRWESQEPLVLDAARLKARVLGVNAAGKR